MLDAVLFSLVYYYYFPFSLIRLSYSWCNISYLYFVIVNIESLLINENMNNYNQ
jgi:hypothetical protein